MTKYFFRLGLLFGAVIAFFALIGALLPRSYSFTTEIEITAPPATIYSEINSLRNWQQWSKQWNPNEIEGLEIQYNGQPSGVGAAQSWTDVRGGDGKLWITATEPDTSIEYDMTFANFPRMTSQIELESLGSKTRVHWSSQGKLPSGPFYGYFAAFFPSQMRAEYDRSLENLKALVEGKHQPTKPPKL